MHNKKLFLILLLSFLLQPIGITAQDKVDSLLQQFKNSPDTLKINVLTDFCWTNRSKAPQLALKAGEEALRISQSINNEKLQAKSLNLMGVVYRNLGNYDKSLSLYKNALRIAEAIKDSNQIAYAYNNIGGLFRLEGNNKLALENIMKALNVFENLQDKAGMAFCTINIGLIYRRQENYIKALEYLNYTIKLREEIKDRAGRALALNLIAEVYFEQEKINLALDYFKEVEKEYTAVDDKKGLAATWAGLGRVYYFKKEYSKAEASIQRALELARRINYLEGQITCLNYLGLIYAQLGNFSKADENFQKALKIAVSTKEIYNQISCYKYLTQYYEIKKDFKNALLYTKKYSVLRDSVLNQENIAFVNEMESANKTEKAEKLNTILIKDIELGRKQRNYFIIIALLVIILAIITYSRYHSKKMANIKLQELNAMKDKFFGIIAHDLKNPFNAIFGFTEILLQDFDNLKEEEKLHLIQEIDNSGRQTYKLLENLLYWSISQTGRMEFKPVILNISEIIKHTFSIFETSAKNKNISLVTNCGDNEEVYADEEMLKTVIRNLVSNGIKFTHKGGVVSVLLKNINGTKAVTVDDNGVGLTEKSIENLFKIGSVSSSEGTKGERGTGLGLILCKEFIERNGGTIWVKSEIGKGSKFIFTIPSKK
ncbi:MAG: tetratricopeptide repeat-containing sensor histidine kinase [Bacteroidota bacterium]